MSDPTLREALDAGMRALRGWHMAWSDGMRGHDHPVEACPLPMFKDVLAALSTTPAHAGKPAMTGEDLTTEGVCGYEFVGVGTRCLTREDHPIHRGAWEGGEPAHRFEPFDRRSGRDRRAASIGAPHE